MAGGVVCGGGGVGGGVLVGHFFVGLEWGAGDVVLVAVIVVVSCGFGKFWRCGKV